MTLTQSFESALANAANTATSSYLHPLRADVAFVDEQAVRSPELQKRAKILTKSLEDAYLALNENDIESFAQDLAESQFLALCNARGIQLNSLATQAGKGTPDFALASNSTTTFEVKAPSIVEGARGIGKDLRDSLEAKIELEYQVTSGARTAFVEREVAPYKDKVSRERINLDHLNVLVEKTRQNIKRDQFDANRSFLVLNLSALPGIGTQLEEMRPVYWSTHPSPHPVSGAMWMLAFGKLGMAIFGHPEFEGKPGIEGFFEKVGILEEYEYINGIFVIRRELGGELQVGLLVRGADRIAWCENDQWEFIDLLVANRWNDELDSNGWQF